MAKFSGFCMSALLIVICLWINVCRYPNAFDGAANASRLTPVSQSSAQTETRTDSAASDSSSAAVATPNPDENDEASRSDAASTNPNDAKSADESQEKKAPRSSEPQGTIFAESSLDGALQTDASQFDVDFAAVSASRSTSAQANFESASAKRGVSADLVPEPSRGVPARLEPETSAKLQPPATASKSLGASKPQGGKYVSIPPIETDALAPTAFEDDCRVIGATRAQNVLFD